MGQNGNGGERVVLLQSVPKQTVDTVTILSAGRAVVLYRALYSTYIVLVSKIPLQQRKCDKEGNGEGLVRRLEELEAVCFRHSCHSPFEKCIKAIVKLVGVGMGTQSHDRHPNLNGEDGRELLLAVSNGLLCHIIRKTSTKTTHSNIESRHFCDWSVLPCTETIYPCRVFFQSLLKILETDCVVFLCSHSHMAIRGSAFCLKNNFLFHLLLRDIANINGRILTMTFLHVH